MDFKFDLAVIGGGPAGMMAAGRAAQLGSKVALIEKNRSLGKKLLLTGKGRCNITNAQFNLKELVREYGKEGGFLLSPFFVFGPKEVIDFFERRGLRVKIERGKRVFPRSDRAKDVLNALLHFLNDGRVRLFLNSEVVELSASEKKINSILLRSGDRIFADNYIISTGGKSYPLTGSTGDGFKWAESLGHEVAKPEPSLVPLLLRDEWPKKLQGLNLKNVKITVFQKDRKQDSRLGEAIFTHFGISGPIILDMSKRIGELLKKGGVELVLDLKPGLDLNKLDARLQRDFQKYQKKLFKNSLSDLLPQKLIPVLIEFSRIKDNKPVNAITREERLALAKLLKGMRMRVESLLDFNTAIVTAGGVSLKEINSKTMKSKLISNLFFAGEIINLDGPSGGYNLQICWTTGYVSGESASKRQADAK